MVLNGKIFEIMVFYRIKHAECNYELGVWFTNRPLQYEITLNRLQKADRFDIIMNKITCRRQFVIKPPSASELNICFFSEYWGK